ncbi:transcription termination/antitermination protein NusG [Ochrobactrum sp. A-1]|uniref:transcription termination/antitermination protein NusG n=1 Tax=Ochrobactrum sp. A-1 TaxID=2920940 RepID=UPI004046777B
MVARWYVLSFQAGRENVAELNLQRQGFETWMPRQIRWVSHARRRYERRIPFFPGYMFISLDLNKQRWRQVNGTVGVRSLIMQGDLPVPCPIGLIEALQTQFGSEGIVDVAETFTVGASVRITSGPFSEAVGTLVHLDGVGRVRILLKMMHGEVAVSLRAHDLISAAA